MASISAAKDGARVILIEAGPKPGRKLLATGGGRCNVTHAGTVQSFLEGFDTRAARFLKAAAYGFPPDEAMRYFESLGITLKTERGDRVFPKSDRAEEILDALLHEARSAGVVLVASASVTAVKTEEEGFEIITGRGIYHSPAVILATGGLSMRRSGSTGDGYAFARALGHTIEPARPSLVPLVTAETWPREVAGLALKNVELAAIVEGKRIRRFGEILFTHHGIGGPITLEISRHLTDILHSGRGPVQAEIDLKPALDEKKLDARLLRELRENPRRHLISVLLTLMPASLAEIFINHFGFTRDTSASQFTREERVRLRLLLKALPLTITATEPIEAALVTRGGVRLSEIEPRTMESRLRQGLFFAGETIDADGDCGGYNLHLCWATGMLAGKSATAFLAEMQRAKERREKDRSQRQKRGKARRREEKKSEP
jgi:predicted Rossmann fold flavoprotein